MKTALKITLACLFTALLWNVAATQTIEYLNPQDYYLTSNFGHWIAVNVLCEKKDPQCTVIYTSVKPVVTELADHRRWAISFKNKP